MALCAEGHFTEWVSGLYRTNVLLGSVCPPDANTHHTADGECKRLTPWGPTWSLTCPVRWACLLGTWEPLPTRGAILVGDKPLWTLVSPLVKRAPAHLPRYQVDWCRGWNETQVKVVWSENRCGNAGSQFSLILTDTVWPCDLSHLNLFYHQ